MGAVDAALDEACSRIQDVLGITTGDRASLFFSGSRLRDQLADELGRYTLFELSHRAQDLEEEAAHAHDPARPRAD